jgi:hypothetical protein
MKDQKEYFVLKDDSSGKLYTRFLSTEKDVQKTYISVGGGFDFKIVADDEVEPAPTHLIVAARLKGDLYKKAFHGGIKWNKDVAATAVKMKMNAEVQQIEFEQELKKFELNMQLQSFRQEVMNYSQIQKGLYNAD